MVAVMNKKKNPFQVDMLERLPVGACKDVLSRHIPVKAMDNFCSPYMNTFKAAK